MTTHRYSRRRKVLLMAAGAGTLVMAGVAVGFIVLLSGIFSTAATKQHFAITYWLLDVGLLYSVRTHARGIDPPPLEAPSVVQTGLSCYRQYCVQCHGAPGIGPLKQGQGMLPVPANLTHSGREWPVEWLYYVTKKGIRMTGMPAWEYRLDEQSLWSTAAFLKRLPHMTRQEYAAQAAAADASLCTVRRDLPAASDRERGKVVLRQYACDSCHMIEGVVGPRTFTGPPLADWKQRKYIAGVLPNTRQNLIRWIRDPHSVSPQTLMPDLDVPEAHAAEMAAFLFSQT